MEFNKAKKFLGINNENLTKDILKNKYLVKVKNIKTGGYSFEDKLILLDCAKKAYKLIKNKLLELPNKIIEEKSFFRSSNQNYNKIYINKNTYIVKLEKNTNLNGIEKIEKKYYIVENNKKREINENEYMKYLN